MSLVHSANFHEGDVWALKGAYGGRYLVLHATRAMVTVVGCDERGERAPGAAVNRMRSSTLWDMIRGCEKCGLTLCHSEVRKP